MPGKYHSSPVPGISHPILPGEFEIFLHLRESNSWRGIWRWGNSQKTSHFPGRNTISLAGSSYIFEGMFPLNKRNIFFFYLIDSWAGKIKRYIPKSMHVSTITFVFTARKSYSIKNIDTFEVLCRFFFKFTTISYALVPTYKPHNNESPMIITEN